VTEVWWSIVIPFIYLVILESLTVRWIAGGPVPGLISRILATNIAGFALLMFVSLTGWFFEWWPEIRNWALRDSFLLFILIKGPIFWFLFRRWGTQKVFTLHILSNFVSGAVLSLLFVYAPQAMAIRPVTANFLELVAMSRIQTIQQAVERYRVDHGYYPKYLWGGDHASWGGVEAPPDPLLSEGYLEAYPVNPLNLDRSFFEPRREPGFWNLWVGRNSTNFLHVHDLWYSVVKSDPRFGLRGVRMGNVLPDPAIPASTLPDDVSFTINAKWLPGGFFYRSYDIDGDAHADAYILGLCGDEDNYASMDSYDARLDTLTRTMTTTIDSVQYRHIVVSAQDGIRDGVIFKVHQGFPANPIERQGTGGPPGDSPGQSVSIADESIQLSAGNMEDSAAIEESTDSDRESD